MAARKRHDPPAATTAAYRPLDAVRGKDPSRHYVWANPNDAISGQALYESMGYIVEEYSKDGPRPLVGMYKEGQPITVMGGPVLMSAPIEGHQERQEACWGEADRVAARIRPGNDGGLEGFKGRENYRVHATVQEER